VTGGESHPTLGERLRDAIEASGKSQRQVAREMAGTADEKRVENERRTLAKYLRDDHAPNSERARRLADIVGKPADYFIEPREERARMAEQLRRLADELEQLRREVEERIREERGGGEGSTVARVDRRLRDIAGAVKDMGAVQETTLLEIRGLRADVEAALERSAAPPRRSSR